MARKLFTSTPEQKKLVESLAGFGIPQEEIRRLIPNPESNAPISLHTLEREFRAELDTGALKANAKVAAALYAKAIGGDTTSMIFWLKTRARWRETQGIDLTINAGDEDEARAAAIAQRLVKKLTTPAA